jgi:uncharacterized protein (DUF1684 family)
MVRFCSRVLVLVLALLGLTGAAAAPPAPADYASEIASWRADRETRLRAESGWLSLAGLVWLKQGSNTMGSAAGNDIVLPVGAAPARAGVIELRGKNVSVRLNRGVSAKVGGKSVRQARLRPDSADTPDVLSLGRLTLLVIERSGRLGVRVKDPQSPTRTGFKGLSWFPVDVSWRVQARFVPHAAPRTLELADVTGAVQKMASPGYVVFQHGGRELRLEPVLEEADAKELFFIFRDLTSGRDTYGAGRYLYSALPQGGTVTLDFNKAYSPPCAFTHFATCPLPPRQNRLPVRVEAGEKHGGHS